jgi:hypothetical protein
MKNSHSQYTYIKWALTLIYVLTQSIHLSFSQTSNGITVKSRRAGQILADASGNEVIGKNDSFQTIETNFPYDQVLWVKKNNKWAFSDLKGAALTPFIFDKMHPANLASYDPSEWGKKDYRWFYKGLTVVEHDTQFAVLNEKMEYVIPWKTYQWISPMSTGGLMIVKQNNKYGLLNHQLKLKQPVTFDTISNYPPKYYFHEQNFPTFWAKKNDKYYILDTLGNWLDSVVYDNITILQANYYLVTKDGNSWRLDRNGVKVVEDFTIIRDDKDYCIAQKDSRVGLVEWSGEIVLPFEYEDINCEHLGNFFVKKDGKWGVVNEDNQQILPCQYDYIAYAWDDNDHKTERNYIVVQNDKFGKVGTVQEVDSLDNIKVTVKEIFPCIYDGITTWVEYGPGGHYVMLNGKMGLIDYKGNIQIPIQYEKVDHLFQTSWAIIYDKGKMGLYNKNNHSFVLPLEYDYIYVDRDWMGFDKHKPTRIITYRNGIINILNKKGNIIQSNVSKTEIKKNFRIDINAYQYSDCSYALSLMKHNSTYQIPDCLMDILKKHNAPATYVYYNMTQDQ